MKKIKNMAMMAVVLLSAISCNNWDNDTDRRVTPPHLVQAYINPAIQGLSLQVNTNGTFSLLPCTPSGLSSLKANPRAYITPESNQFIYDSLRYAYNDHNKMRVRSHYVTHHGEISSSYHYQVLCKEIKRIDIKTTIDLNNNYPSGSIVNDLFKVQGLINMKEELSRSPQNTDFPDERYKEKMSLPLFNSHTRSMVALPLLFSIDSTSDIDTNECAFSIEITFTSGEKINLSTPSFRVK